jgi:hypothetical protein
MQTRLANLLYLSCVIARRACQTCLDEPSPFDLTSDLHRPRRSPLGIDLHPPARTRAIGLPARSPVLEGVPNALAPAKGFTNKAAYHQLLIAPTAWLGRAPVLQIIHQVVNSDCHNPKNLRV